ncbi:MAG: hypothetical protein H7Z73_05435 [Candidatus Saccharibacteria bacterium]|nr:hypothetical protein [Moraxellaceae bacterium]
MNSESKLISAGFKAENDQEFYFELTDNYQKSDCSYFVLENVLPHLKSDKYCLQSAQAAFKLKSWIEAFGEPVQLACDAPTYDGPLIVLLMDQHKCWPENLDRKILDVGNYLISERIERYFEVNDFAIRHHALWDARALAAAAKGSIND